MLNYVRQFIKISVVFHTLYIWNEDGYPHFFAFLAQVTHYLTAVKIKKKSMAWKNFARTSLLEKELRTACALRSADQLVEERTCKEQDLFRPYWSSTIYWAAEQIISPVEDQTLAYLLFSSVFHSWYLTRLPKGVRHCFLLRPSYRGGVTLRSLSSTRN